MVGRGATGAGVVTVGALVALAGTFLTWIRSGARDRSSYEVADLVERLGFASGGVVSWSLRLWPVVPLLLVAVTILAWRSVAAPSSRRWMTAAAAVTVVWPGGTAIAMYLAPSAGVLRVGPGPSLTLAGAALVAVGVALVSSRGSAASGAA